ncbi:FAD:protein FMN transferase [Noviherbaspirillum sp. 17J57-3]|uniref:FAD:protein FMN transferase n=2 Tax=Noviherbaspirillum galbum TaxID=2709383 RepID=A0A6B3STC8_9BURK|nr:FAD:protein FMN transferase [Noviherbaspirillum galbum]
MRRRQFLAAGMGIVAAACGWERMLPEGQRVYRGASLAFGTTVSMQVVHHDEGAAMEAISAAFAAAAEVDRLMSLYRPDSQVRILNDEGRLGHPHPHLLRVLETAQYLSMRTQGAFDVTVQPLWEPSVDGRDRSQALQKVGWRDLAFSAHEVRLKRPGMAVTLNGIAQGYATDVALATLRRRGIEHALVDIGELRSAGRRDQAHPWQIGLADPRREAAMIAAAAMDGRGVATSGDYATRFADGYADHHIWNPLTGRSPEELSSVTVFAPDAMMADGLSTALMVLGREEGMRLVSDMKGVDVFMVDKAGRIFRTANVPLI